MSYRAPRILGLRPPDSPQREPLARIARAIQMRAEAGVLVPRRSPRIAIAPSPAPATAKPIQAVTCQRRRRRTRTSLPGIITVPHLGTDLPCTITDLSSEGARLYVPPTSLGLVGGMDALPVELLLALRSDRVQVPCEICWRLTSSMGIRFTDVALPVAAPRIQ